MQSLSWDSKGGIGGRFYRAFVFRLFGRNFYSYAVTWHPMAHFSVIKYKLRRMIDNLFINPWQQAAHDNVSLKAAPKANTTDDVSGIISFTCWILPLPFAAAHVTGKLCLASLLNDPSFVNGIVKDSHARRI